MERVLRVIDLISDYSGRIFSVAVLIATIVVVYEVVMRYVFGSPSSWGFELPIIMAGTSYLMSGAYTERFDAHVKVDLLWSRWSPRTQAVMDLVTAPIFFVSLALLAWYGLDWTLAAYEAGTRTGTSWNPPAWPMRLLIPVGSALLLVQGFARLVRNIRTAVTGEDRREPPAPPEPR